MFAKLYWILPLVSACMWFSMLMGMLLTWVVQGEPVYASEDPGQKIAFISDVGAARLKPLFIGGSVVTVVLLDLAMIAERWLRHQGKLARNTSWIQKVLSMIAIIGAIAGALGLILLSIFDTFRHPTLHNDFLILFIVGYIVSAIFICAEYQRLGVHYHQHPILRASFWIKFFFIIVEVGVAIGFGVCNKTGKPNTAAILEWTLAFVFTFYILTFVMDLLPAVRTKHHYSEETVTEMGHSELYMNESHGGGGNTNGGNTNGGNTSGGYSNGRYTNGGYTNGGYQNDGYTNGSYGTGVRDPTLPASRNF